MKRVALSIVGFVFILSTFMAFAAGDADARRYHKYHGHQYHKHHYKKHAWVAPSSPAGKSTWCKNHPSKCHKRSSGDPKVNTKYENCMDAKGNGDGYMSGWEKGMFGGVCK